MAIVRRISGGRPLIVSCLAFLFVACGEPALAASEPSIKAPATGPVQPPDDSPPRIAGPRESLARHGVGDNYFDNLIDGWPINDEETGIVLKIMYWVRRFPMTDVQRWAHDTPNLPEMVQDPEASRGRIFSLSGRVTDVEVCRLEPEPAERFEMQRYYRCQFLLDDRQPAVIFTDQIPKAWQGGEPIDERAGAYGLFLKFAGEENDRPTPVFVAPRVAWHPKTLLGNLGMDVGLLDNVVHRTSLARGRRKGLYDLDQEEALRASREREAFYAMLDAVGRAKPSQLLREADRLLREAPKELKTPDEEEFSVAPLFNEPDKQHGRLVVLSGRARRVVRIRVDDPDIVARFGIDHYYEMAVYTDDSLGNPIVFCVRELPQGMPTGDDQEYGEYVRVAGFFLKAWAFHVQRPEETPEQPGGSGRRRQVAPLLIGRRPLWYPQQESGSSTLIGLIGGGLFLLALLGVWLAMWKYGRGDKQFHDETIAKTFAMDSGISLNEIGLSADGTPDFSRLDELDRGDDR